MSAQGRFGVLMAGAPIEAITNADGIITAYHLSAAIPLGDAANSSVAARALAAALLAVSAPRT
ncbi:hypothetical protein ACOZ38_28960 [Sphaerisporangium viridialbum]|uniref:hypothetical protein n=1 Tax=Sphaerisporangium viridialbum TaxID=46189 RepID=UPI003C744D72